jgi:hypothetical protein
MEKLVSCRIESKWIELTKMIAADEHVKEKAGLVGFFESRVTLTDIRT